MTDLCKTCYYRAIVGANSVCDYICMEGKPRGCDPSQCLELGKYKEGHHPKGYSQWSDMMTSWDGGPFQIL